MNVFKAKRALPTLDFTEREIDALLCAAFARLKYSCCGGNGVIIRGYPVVPPTYSPKEVDKLKEIPL